MDFSYLTAISDGDQDFIDEFISTFERNAGNIIADIKAARAKNDLDIQKKLAHQLKPSLEMLGLSSLQIALNIQNDPTSVNDADVDEMESECTKAVEALKQEFNQ